MAKRSILIIIFILASTYCYAYSLLDYMTDKSKPIVSSDFVAGNYYKGKITIPFVITDDGTLVKEVEVYLDANDVTKKVKFGDKYYRNSLSIDTEDLRDGEHTLTIIALDAAKQRNRAIQEIIFYADNTPPLLKLASGGGMFSQGKTGIIYFTSTEPSLEISGVFQGKDLRIYPFLKRYRAVIGFAVDEPGNQNYYLMVKAKDRAGNESVYHYKVYMGTLHYGVSRFVLKPKKAVMLMPDTIRDDWKKIEDIVVEENSQKYWWGRFWYPLKAPMTMNFGRKEYINGEEAGRHRGMDLAAPEGTPIKASNAGMVRLAERLPAHGNTVVIEHGQGIFTYYAHMVRTAVHPGEMVKKGQVIGYVGKTGVATGPHLHFSMSVHNLRVDPAQWIDGTFTP
jgi:hypothetical protein